MVIEAGRALVIAYNKWDLVDEDRRQFLDKEIDRQLYTARWAPRVNISASTGWHVDRLVPALETALAGWETRVPTGQLNAWLSALIAATRQRRAASSQRSCSRRRRGRSRLTRPATSASSGRVPAFHGRRLREEFGFQGTPVHLSMRLREKRSAAARGAPGGRRG